LVENNQIRVLLKMEKINYNKIIKNKYAVLVLVTEQEVYWNIYILWITISAMLVVHWFEVE